MTCPKCNSDNVIVTTEQAEGKTRTRNTGCLWKIGRVTLIICTCGLWLLIGKRKETGNTKYKNKTVAICQNCGNKWYIK